MMTTTTNRRDDLIDRAQSALATTADGLRTPIGRAVLAGVNIGLAAANLAEGNPFVAIALIIFTFTQVVNYSRLKQWASALAA